MKRRTVRWADSALRDVERLVDFLFSRSIPEAESAWTGIRSAAVRMESFTERGRVVPELAKSGVKTYREVIVLRRYRLVYRASERSVLVVAVLDDRRDLADLLLERFVPR